MQPTRRFRLSIPKISYWLGPLTPILAALADFLEE